MQPMAIGLSALVIAVGGCGETAKLQEQASTGPRPLLPEPNQTLIPTVLIATAKGWSNDAKPRPASELSVSRYAANLDHPRWLYVLPNGDVLVAETNAPKRSEEGSGLKGWIYQTVQGWAGAGVPSANRITLLRDADGDGSAETRTVFLSGLNSPFGMALVGHDLYVANTVSGDRTK
jgi:glucose/arabinose dehydrogenase